MKIHERPSAAPSLLAGMLTCRSNPRHFNPGTELTTSRTAQVSFTSEAFNYTYLFSLVNYIPPSPSKERKRGGKKKGKKRSSRDQKQKQNHSVPNSLADTFFQNSFLISKICTFFLSFQQYEEQKQTTGVSKRNPGRNLSTPPHGPLYSCTC